MFNPYSLEGKTILITGASSGIGRETAIECSKMGAKIVITARNEERLRLTLELLEGEGHRMIIGDICSEDFTKQLATDISELNGVFLNAGVSDTTLVKFITEDKIDRVFDVNVKAPVLLMKYLLKKKKITEGASLVWMSSYGAEKVEPGLGIYAASKNAINSFMKAYAKELIGRKVRSNSIMPMMIRTELLDTLTNLTEEDWKKQEELYPLGFGKPEDVAQTAIFLLSDASRWITGTQIKMGGGCDL